MYLEYHSACSLVRDPLTPFPASECAPGTKVEGVQTQLRVWEWGSPNSDDWIKSSAICLQFVWNQEKKTRLKVVTSLLQSIYR